MIDIHCHLLPAADDGAENPDEALEMAFSARDSGSEIIVMTPHCNLPDADEKNYRSNDLTKRFDAFRTVVEAAGLDLQVLPGAEVLATPEVPQLLREGKLQTLADSHYLLIEFFFDEDLRFMDEILHGVMAEGYKPVLAHPERYFAIQQDPTIIGRWFCEDIVIQLNKDSILGRLGGSAKHTAEWILSHGLAHAVASDAHGIDLRTPNLAGVHSLLAERYDPIYADILLNENPGRICRDLPMLSPD